MKQNKLLKSIVTLGILSLLFSACSSKQVDVTPKYKLTNKQSKEAVFSLKQGRKISLDQLIKEDV